MTPPLLPAFALLRPRLGLGLGEYADLLRALAAGFGAGSRAELVALCQALWAKTPEDRRLVAAVVGEHLPARFTDQDLRRLEEAADRPPPPPPESPDRPPRVDHRTEVAHRPEPAGAVRAGQLAEEPGGSARLRPAIPPDRLGEPWRFNLTGDAPRLSREFLREWRGYRRMLRAGPAADLDVPATLERRVRDGVLVAPALLPARRNRVSLLLLLDVGRSMTPFRWRVAALVGAARRAGFAAVSVAYFQGTPAGVLASDPGLVRHLSPEDLIRTTAAPGAAVVVGDAGAAVVRRDEAEGQATAAFLTRLRDRMGWVGWVNPTPAARWGRSTAGLIQSAARVPMVELSGAGLRRLVGLFRGRDVR